MKRLLASLMFCSLFQVSCNHWFQQESEQDKLIRAGERMQASGDPSSAINIYKNALAKNPPRKLPLYLKLGEAYMSAGHIEEAKKTYEEALPFDESDQAKKQLGRLYLSIGQPDEAISIFNGVILIHKYDAQAFNGLGVAHNLKGEHHLAHNFYQKALEINKDNNEFKSNLGLSFAFSGQYKEALALLQPIGEALGATSKQRHNLALVYALSGNQSKAQDIFMKDMDMGEVNENLHAVHMALKPKKALSKQTLKVNARNKKV